jgi:hypothetical protein
MQGSNISIVIDNKSHTISKTHLAFEKVKQAIKEQDWDLVRELIEPAEVVIKYGAGNIHIENGEVLWNGKEMHNALTQRMIAMLEEGFVIEPLVNFMNNLMENPSYRSVTELYSFLEANNLPITPDGYFLAYKKIRSDYTDCHTGKMDNSVGKIVEMARNEVDDNQNNTCSAGLHFCSESYLNHFSGDRTVIVKINPKDVVSIPTDYDNSKGRACRYEVIAELGVEPAKAFTKPVQSQPNTIVIEKKPEPWFNEKWPSPKS